MSDGNIPLTGQANIDDLPRTLRREHEARAREAREREGHTFGNASISTGGRAASDTTYPEPQSYEASVMAGEPYPAVVKALDIPFVHLVAFCLKAVLAAIPAILLLMVILWGVGQIIETVMPNLLKMKILISFPNS